jgi:hypothetical protein
MLSNCEIVLPRIYNLAERQAEGLQLILVEEFAIFGIARASNKTLYVHT